jgi:hypothetical protein
MAAYDLAIQNFAVAEHLLQLYELFHGLKEETAIEDLRLVVCRKWGIPETTCIRNACNDRMFLVSRATAPIPPALLIENGADFLLRQAVVVSCTALESFFWDSLRENVLTIVRARRRGADESLRDLKLTLDDYLSLENYSDQDERLKQIILKNFERGTLYDTGSIEKIASILTVREFWDSVARQCGSSSRDIRRNLDELIQRRNQITHRADRPNPEADPPEEQDVHGLRAINFAWVNARVSMAKSVVNASHECFHQAMQRLEQQLVMEREQELARKTLEGGASES